MQFFSIGQVARSADIPISTIRYYERIGLLPPCPQVNGKRRYETGIFQKLRIIRMAQAAGYNLTEIHTLLYEFPDGTPPSERWQAFASQKMAALDAQIQQLQDMKNLLQQTMACECPTLDDCAAGIEKTAC